ASHTPLVLTLSLHDALPISVDMAAVLGGVGQAAGVAGAEAAEQLRQWLRAGFAGEHHAGVGFAENQPVTLGMEGPIGGAGAGQLDRKSTRLNSSHVKISYAV